MSADSMDEGAVCMPNLGRREIQKRMRMGMVFGVVTAVTAGAMVVLHAPRAARAAVFIPALMSAYGVFQAREKT